MFRRFHHPYPTLDHTLLEEALSLAGKDFEDNVQMAAAKRHTIDGIVTRDPADFRDATVAVFSPEELFKRLL